MADNGVVAHYLANNPAARLQDRERCGLSGRSNYGLAVKKGNAELLAKIDKGLAEIKADGTYEKIYAARPAPRRK